MLARKLLMRLQTSSIRNEVCSLFPQGISLCDAPCVYQVKGKAVHQFERQLGLTSETAEQKDVEATQPFDEDGSDDEDFAATQPVANPPSDHPEGEETQPSTEEDLSADCFQATQPVDVEELPLEDDIETQAYDFDENDFAATQPVSVLEDNENTQAFIDEECTQAFDVEECTQAFDDDECTQAFDNDNENDENIFATQPIATHDVDAEATQAFEADDL